MSWVAAPFEAAWEAVEDVGEFIADAVVDTAEFVVDVGETIVDVVADTGELVVDVVEDVGEFVVEDIIMDGGEWIVDTAVNAVEGVVHTITHPTEDPFATIMLAIAVYSGYQSWSSAANAEAAIISESVKAGEAAKAAAVAKGWSAAKINVAVQSASEAVLTSAGVTLPAVTAQAVAGPMFDAQFLGSTIGMDMAVASTGLAEAGVILSAGAHYGMAGPSLSVQAGTFGGVGAGSAAGSMTGIGGMGGITGARAGNVFLNDLQSVWTDTDFSASEDFEFSTDYAESEAAWGDEFVDTITKPFEKVKNFGSEFLDDITEDYKKFADDPMGEAWEYAEREAERRYPFLSDPKIPTSTDELIELGVDMAATNFANWSPTISYQAGGDPGSSTSESYPSFTRAETGILGDPFNLEGQDLALTVSGLASQLQQQRGLPFGQQEMGMAPPVQQFRDRQAPAEELKQLLDPSYAVNQYQQPMVNEMINQLNANSQVRGLAPSAEGVSRGVAPLLSKLRQDNLASLNRAAGLDLEARGQGVQQRAGDITSQLGYQDIGMGGDVARKNITLNSLLALAQMSKPTIIGGTTQRGSSQAASPGTVFSGAVPVGNILSTGWDWLTGDNNNNSGVDGTSVNPLNILGW